MKYEKAIDFLFEKKYKEAAIEISKSVNCNTQEQKEKVISRIEKLMREDAKNRPATERVIDFLVRSINEDIERNRL